MRRFSLALRLSLTWEKKLNDDVVTMELWWGTDQACHSTDSCSYQVIAISRAFN